MRRLLLTLLAPVVLSLFSPGALADGWTVEAAKRLPKERKGRKAPNGLPDGHVARARGGNVKSAWYGAPTRRYQHAILGDDIEAGSLIVKTASGKQLRYDLDQAQVFEDRTPRLVDLDGFGDMEIVTIVSHRRKGGSIAVFSVIDDTLKLVAQTPYIGRSNRWLNIAGFGDFDGRGRGQIAAVWTPHIGGTLKFWTWTSAKSGKSASLTLAHEAWGFSNHAIGSREQNLSAVVDIDRDGVDDLALPSADRRALRLVKVTGAGIEDLAVIPLPGEVSSTIFAKGEGQNVEFTLGLTNGKVVRVQRKN
ncbi:MAG: hypothetical protein AAGF28_06560 [Pseudomonadota bacterium]